MTTDTPSPSPSPNPNLSANPSANPDPNATQDPSSRPNPSSSPNVDPPSAPERVRFDDMPLSPEARLGLKALGYELATPVQAATFDPAMAGEDLMVQSKTGTGKTTGFGLPMIERISLEEGLVDPQGLILCPTRELAIQVAEELAELGDPKGVRVLPLYGGAPIGPQLKALTAGCDIVVGTPGRVLDHVRRRTLRLVHTHIAVLDEADEMLSMGFWEEVTAILDQLPRDRQTLLFSATLPDEIRRTAQNYMRKARSIDISRDELTVENIVNVVYETDERLPRPRNLLYVLEVERPDNAIIFCNTRDDVAVVAAFLRRQGLHALAISGDFAQKDRERIMRRMKSRELQYLVATDVAARGIDISDLSHVINYALPDFTEVYVHRVGRTGRAGKKGVAVSLVSGRDEMTYTELERLFGIEFEKRALPPHEEIMRLQAARVHADLLKTARDVELAMLIPLAEQLLQQEGAAEVFAYFLKGHFAALEAERARVPGSSSEGPGRQNAEGGSGPSRDAFDASRGDDEGQDQEPSRSRRGARRRGEDRPARDGGERRDRRDRREGSRGRRPSQDRASSDRVSSDRDSNRDRGRDRGASSGDGAGAGPAADSAGAPDRTRLFVSRGSSDGYDDRRVRQLVLDAAASPDAEAIFRVVLRRTHAFVETRSDVAEAAIAAAVRGVEREDKPVAIEPARTRGP
ncbi:MAG: DEAD/DEAH box helicase [Deltaproteobacteria bacterium]|nr:DEAD/DEAH box helicase [Deltaproteobacteria bacterium]